jgi:hypothetical protein
MLAIEAFIFVFAVILVVAFAIIVNPPSALVNMFSAKKDKKQNPKP